MRLYLHLSLALVVGSAIAAGCDEKATPPRPDPGKEAERQSRAAAAVTERARSEAIAPAVRAAEDASREAVRSRPGGIATFGSVSLPPGGRVRRGGLTIDDGLSLVFEGHSIDLPPDFRFLPCGEAVVDDAAQKEGEQFIDDRPFFWTFDDAAGRRLAVRFSVEGVVARAFDEEAACEREGDLTPFFVGASLPEPAALFAPEGLPYLEKEAKSKVSVGSEEGDGPSSATSGRFSWRVDAESFGVSADGEDVLWARYSLSELDRWTVRAGLVDGGWFRLIVDGERTLGRDEAVVGRRDTLVWPVHDTEVGAPIFVRQWVSGEEDAERSDAQMTLERRIDAGGGSIIGLEASRREGDRPLMLGVGKCPELEGLTDVTWSDTEVRWTLRRGDSSREIGGASRWQLDTAGCLSAVKGVVKRGGKIFSDRIAAAPVEHGED